MQELYNCKRVDNSHYRITKFDKHLDPRFNPKGKQSSYILSENECDCPQGNQRSCRHRKMLPFFVDHEYVDTEYFFVWDTHQWYKPTGVFREARQENRKSEPALPINVIPPEDRKDIYESDDAWIEAGRPKEGGPKPASGTPSSQPSQTYRRF